jgi:hypothetical protein
MSAAGGNMTIRDLSPERATYMPGEKTSLNNIQLFQSWLTFVWISTPSFTGGYSYLALAEPIPFI